VADEMGWITAGWMMMIALARESADGSVIYYPLRATVSAQKQPVIRFSQPWMATTKNNIICSPCAHLTQDIKAQDANK